MRTKVIIIVIIVFSTIISHRRQKQWKDNICLSLTVFLRKRYRLNDSAVFNSTSPVKIYRHLANIQFSGAAWIEVKGFRYFKTIHFIIKERFNKLIYGINTIIKYGTRQSVKFQLISSS